MDFIYENRARLDGHTFYAHNGGSYDAMFLFKEGLLEGDRFDILEPPLDQDGNTSISSSSSVVIRSSRLGTVFVCCLRL